MPQTKTQIREYLDAAAMQPRKQFGQNFMVDANLVRLVADAGEIARDDLVIEVGPGTGTLTEELLERAGRVVAVEIDRDLASHLRQHFASRDTFSLIEGDALSGKHALNPALLGAIAGATSVKLVANLPYNIASPLVVELLLAGVGLLAFTVQKEVAERLAARAGEDAYGPLSVIVQKMGTVELLRTLGPGAFWPPPSIDSALVRVRRHATLPRADELRRFNAFVHGIFLYRRKTLRRALSEAGHDAAAILSKTAIDGQLRPEVLTMSQLESLAAAGSSNS